MNTKPYESVHIRMIKFLSVCLIVPMLIYCCYSYTATKSRLVKNYQEQTLNTMEATSHSITSYMRIADFTAKSIHFNSEILPLLKLNGQKLSPSRQLQVTNQLFGYLQQLYGIVPKATQIHLDAYKLRRLMILTDTFQQYEKEHIYVWKERKVTTPPYETYINPTHLQYDYNFTNTDLNTYAMVVTLVLPIYDIPATDEPIAKLSIDIPLDVFQSMCSPLYDEAEHFSIIDSKHHVIFSSDAAANGTLSSDPLFLTMTDQAAASGQSIIHSSRKDYYYCVPIQDSSMNWYMIKTTPKNYVYRDASIFLRHSTFLLFLSLLIALTLSVTTVMRQTEPLRQLTKYTDAIQKGNLNEHLSDYLVYTENDEIGSLIRSIQKMIYSINHFVIREYQLELANKSSELKALQAQINPHFIYNTLQCIAAESLETHNLEVYRSITTLGHMMQYSMDTRNNKVTLKQELANCSNYIRLQKMRFSNKDIRLELNNEPDTLEILVPKMILQPLVENAFKHGNLLKIPDACIQIRSFLKDQILHILVEDNGIGISFHTLAQVQEQLKNTKEELTNQGANTVLRYFTEAEQHAKQEEPSDTSSSFETRLKNDRQNVHISNHIGLCNVYMRLLLMYNNQCQLSIYPNDECGTTIHIEIILNTLEEGVKQTS